MLPFYNYSHADETPGIMRYYSSMREYGGKITPPHLHWGGGPFYAKTVVSVTMVEIQKSNLSNDFVGSAPEYLDMSAPCVT